MNLRPARRLAFFSSLLALFCSANVLADAPGLDSSFGIGGRVAVELGAYGSRANAVAVQPDGKIVVAGSSASAAGKDFMLFRLLPDGSLDAAFGANGTVSTAVSAADDEALSLVLQADGKIIAAGYSVNDDKNRDFAMIRCNADGSLDNTFGMGGVAVTAVGSSHDEITDVTVQADGGIVITGSALDSSGHQVVVLGRYLADGNPDLSFAEDGFALSIVGFDAQAESVLTDADGRILVSGSYSDSRRTGLMLLGFTAAGQLDHNFGVNGIAVPADSSTFSEGYGMFIQADGKILVAGSVGKEGERDAALFRFAGDGGPDSGFGAQGVVVTAASAEDDALYDAAVIGETIAATGFKTVAGRRAFLLITYAAAQDNPAQLNATVADVGFSDGEETPTALAAASSSSLVMVGQSGADPKSSALVGKYSMAALDEAASTVGSTETGNQHIVTGRPYDVTRTTVMIPAKILAGLGSVTKRGVVFGTAPNPVLDGGSPDDKEPVRSNLSPSGTVVGTSATLTLSTDVAAACKYSTNAGTGYDQMEGDFTPASSGKSHSKLVSNLAAGEKKYAVRCKNTATGAMNTTDVFITFTVSSMGTDEGPVRSNLSPKNGTSSSFANLRLDTDVAATCKYSSAAGTAYDQMENSFTAESGGKSHSKLISNLAVGDYKYAVRCKNTATGAVNTTDEFITFTVSNINDTTPPIITNKTKDSFSSSESVELKVATDEKADCRYRKNDDAEYDEMTEMSSDATGENHLSDIGKLPKEKYTYYIRCKDNAGNINTFSKKIAVTVTDDVLPPSIMNNTSAIFSSENEVVLLITTNESSECKYNKDSDADYGTMGGNFSANTDGKIHSVFLGKALQAQEYNYYARCKDDAGNKNTSGTKITFTVAAASSLSPSHSQLFAVSDKIARESLQSIGNFFIGTAIAKSGCCSYHGGVCGDKCCDGTALSEKCDGTDDTGTTVPDTTTSTSNTTSSNTGGTISTAATSSGSSSAASEFLEKGSSSDGSGTGSFSSQLENLKPGTYFYARAYAVVGGAVYYGNQVTFQTQDSCFVATAAFGSVFHPSVQVLRDFRDRFMTSNALGRSLVDFYYQHSPSAADFIRERGSLRFAVRMLLLPVTGVAWTLLQLGPQLSLLLPAAALLLTAGWLAARWRQRKACA